MVSTYDIPQLECVCMIFGPESPWYNDIYPYLHDQYMSLDLSHNQCKALMHQASRHVIIADTLYRKSLDGNLLRCVDFEEAQLALKEVHDGICGTHYSGPTLAKKLLHIGYYWPTMEKVLASLSLMSTSVVGMPRGRRETSVAGCKSDHIRITHPIKCCAGDIFSSDLIRISQAEVRLWGVSSMFCQIGIAILNTKTKPHIKITDKGSVTSLCYADRVNYSNIIVLE